MTAARALFLMIVVWAPPGFAAAPTCESASGIVLAKNTVLLHCNSDWPGTPQFKALWRVPKEWSKDPRQQGTALAVAATVSETPEHDNAYRLIRFDKDLDPGVNYYLLLEMPGAEASAKPLTVLLSTIPEAVIERDRISAHWGRDFTVRSPVALAPGLSAHRSFIELKGPEAVPHESCILILYEERATPSETCKPRPADPRRLATAGVAKVTLLSETLTQAKTGARVEGLVNIFGETVKAETKPDKPIELAAVPGSKDASKWYLRFGYQKAQGSPYSLNLDLKANPVLTHIGPMDVQPDIVVDIAQNEPASANPRSSDTIRLGGSLYYLRMFDPAKNPWLLEAFDIRPGAALETDREISKKNVLAGAESQLYLRGFTKTTEMQRRRRAAPKHLSTDEVAPANLGYAIGIYFGFEAGKSVIAQTFSNIAKTGTILVPTYTIARFWPRIRQTYELGPITFDVNTTVKYLGDPELVGHEESDGSLDLRAVKGWRFYGEGSMLFALDRGKHANFVVTWKRGARAPNWIDMNTVITGFGFAY